jgi:hypothetical protein
MTLLYVFSTRRRTLIKLIEPQPPKQSRIPFSNRSTERLAVRRGPRSRDIAVRLLDQLPTLSKPSIPYQRTYLQIQFFNQSRNPFSLTKMTMASSGASCLVGSATPLSLLYVFFTRIRTLFKLSIFGHRKTSQISGLFHRPDSQDDHDLTRQLSGEVRHAHEIAAHVLQRNARHSSLFRLPDSQDDHDLVRRQLSGGVRDPHEVAVRVLHRDAAPAQLHKALPLESAHSPPQLHVAHVKPRKQHLDRLCCLLLRAVFAAV